MRNGQRLGKQVLYPQQLNISLEQAVGTFRKIVSEELDAFFAGDKTAAETARIIQNRMTTYLNE